MSSSLFRNAVITDCIVHFKDGAQAVDKLNSGRGDGDECYASDHFKCACNDLHAHVSFLLSGLLIHSSVPTVQQEC